MPCTAQLAALMQADPIRWHLLHIVRSLNLPDCWIGAGLVRNAVWTHQHGRPAAPPDGDIDVIWHDPATTGPSHDRKHEAALTRLEPRYVWSVKNQARMHTRNGDAPYTSATDAIRYWPETATAIAVRRTKHNDCEIAAPYGLSDLFNLLLRPTPRFAHDKRDIYEARLRAKQWPTQWPCLRDADS